MTKKEEAIKKDMAESGIYVPTRIEYFAASALQALLTTASAKNRDNCVFDAVEVAKMMDKVLEEVN